MFSSQMDFPKWTLSLLYCGICISSPSKSHFLLPVPALLATPSVTQSVYGDMGLWQECGGILHHFKPSSVCKVHRYTVFQNGVLDTVIRSDKKQQWRFLQIHKWCVHDACKGRKSVGNVVAAFYIWGRWVQFYWWSVKPLVFSITSL